MSKLGIRILRDLMLASSVCGGLLAATAVHAQDKPLKIGVLGYQQSDTLHGSYTLEAIRMAVEDAGGTVLGQPIEILTGHDEAKPDIGIPIAKKWLESDGIDLLVSTTGSNTTLGLVPLSKAHNVPLFLVNAGASLFTGKECSPMTTQWVYDTYSTAKPVVDVAIADGKKKWYLATSDYAFGYAVEADFKKILEAAGGEMVGATFAPLLTPDFSSFLLQINASDAEGVAISIGAGDQETFLKQMTEFGMNEKFARMMFVLFTNQIIEAGIDNLAGINLALVFYHDQNEETRAWTKRFMERTNGRVPNVFQASAYEAVNHYLKAVAAAGTYDGEAVMAKMREIPVNDFGMKDVKIREDGQVMRPMLVAQVKSPGESTNPDTDLLKIIGEVPAEQAWRTLEEGGCPLVSR